MNTELLTYSAIAKRIDYSVEYFVQMCRILGNKSAKREHAVEVEEAAELHMLAVRPV